MGKARMARMGLAKYSDYLGVVRERLAEATAEGQHCVRSVRALQDAAFALGRSRSLRSAPTSEFVDLSMRIQEATQDTLARCGCRDWQQRARRLR